MCQQALDVLCAEVHIIQEHHLVCLEMPLAIVSTVAAAVAAAAAICCLMVADKATMQVGLPDAFVPAAAAAQRRSAGIIAFNAVRGPPQRLQHLVAHPGQKGDAAFFFLACTAI